MMKTRPACEGSVLSVNFGAGGKTAESMDMGAIFESDVYMLFRAEEISEIARVETISYLQ